MKRLAFCTLLVIGSPATAATFCISLTSPVYTGTRCGTVPDAAVPAFFASYADSYGSVAIPAVLDAKGIVVTPATTRAATMDEEFRAFASGMSRGISDNVMNWMKTRDAKIATDKVAPIVIVPVP